MAPRFILQHVMALGRQLWCLSSVNWLFSMLCHMIHPVYASVLTPGHDCPKVVGASRRALISACTVPIPISELLPPMSPLLRRSSVLGQGSIRLRKVLVLALLAVLPSRVNQTTSASDARYFPVLQVQLTSHFANRKSISPRRSAASRLSSFRLRRTTRPATAR